MMALEVRAFYEEDGGRGIIQWKGNNPVEGDLFIFIFKSKATTKRTMKLIQNRVEIREKGAKGLEWAQRIPLALVPKMGLDDSL